MTIRNMSNWKKLKEIDGVLIGDTGSVNKIRGGYRVRRRHLPPKNTEDIEATGKCGSCVIDAGLQIKGLLFEYRINTPHRINEKWVKYRNYCNNGRGLTILSECKESL